MDNNQQPPMNPNPPNQSPPQFQQSMPSRPPANGLAVAGMVVGIVAIVMCLIPFLGVVLALVATPLSIMGLKKSKENDIGKGQAVAGLILGIVTLVISLFITISLIVAVDEIVENVNLEEEVSDLFDNIETAITEEDLHKNRIKINEADLVECGQDIESFDHFCDAEGKILRVEEYDDGGYLEHYWLYEYDTDDNLIKIENYDADGNLLAYLIHEYDDEGFVKAETYDANGKWLDAVDKHDIAPQLPEYE